jgi:RNA polymerase sigma-70 factor (ECF subfamily)
MRKKKVKHYDLNEEITAEVPEEEVEEGISGLDENEQKIIIDKLLEMLPELDRALVTLFYLENNTVHEISEVTGLGESNVKVRLHRIRKKFYSQLQQILEKRTLSIS